MLYATISAISWHLAKTTYSKINSESVKTFDYEVSFLIFQMSNMPDYLRVPFKLLSIYFGMHTILFYGKPFFKLKPYQREKVILTWKNARISFMPVYIKFHESLITLSVYSKR